MAMKKETTDLLKLLGFGLVGGVVSALVVNITPGIKDARPVWKSIGQLGAGFALMLIGGRWEVVKLAGVGAFMAGGLMGFERLTGLKTLAGPRARLSLRDLEMLQTRGALSGPMAMRPQLSGPMKMRPMNTAPQFMGTSPQFMGRSTAGFKSSN